MYKKKVLLIILIRTIYIKENWLLKSLNLKKEYVLFVEVIFVLYWILILCSVLQIVNKFLLKIMV